MREWATRKLKYGDLTALKTVKRGHKSLPEDRLSRLSSRGFVAKKDDGEIVVTLPGRFALLVRSLSPH